QWARPVQARTAQPMCFTVPCPLPLLAGCQLVPPVYLVSARRGVESDGNFFDIVFVPSRGRKDKDTTLRATGKPAAGAAAAHEHREAKHAGGAAPVTVATVACGSGFGFSKVKEEEDSSDGIDRHAYVLFGGSHDCFLLCSNGVDTMCHLTFDAPNTFHLNAHQKRPPLPSVIWCFSLKHIGRCNVKIHCRRR
ncbi:hypothetical protein GW17_00055760, partial [Ensete ventricosum]